ncbi:Fucose permease [Lelliottia nimipressuralis]
MYTNLLVLSLLLYFWCSSMTLISPRKALQRRLWALFMFFFIPGLLMASWATRTPAIRDILSVSTAEMGIVLFGLSIGSMSGILCSAWLVKRFGTRKVIRTTMCSAVVGMLILSAALWFASPVMFAFGLMVFGGSFGAAEVAINVEGAAVERELNKTVLPMMHGFYSLGTLAGAGVGMALTAFGTAASLHILLAALICILPILTGITFIPDGTGKNSAEEQKSTEKGLPFYRDMQLMLIGVVVLAMAFAEGSANDWLPLLMVDGHGFSPTSGSLIYAGFTLGMTVGRFTGGWFIDRYSRVAVVRASAMMGALGIALIIFVDVDWIAGVSVILWGAGASLGFPLTISAASDTGPDAPTRVSVVATTGYLAFLVGPPLLGFLGEHYGLRSAMLVVLALVIVAALVAKAVAKPTTQDSAMEKGYER